MDWLPWRRHREEKRKAEEARRKQEQKEVRRESGDKEANGSNTLKQPGVGNEEPEPANPPLAEEDVPCISIHQEIWKEAYEVILKDDPSLVESYFKALKKSMGQDKEASDSEGPDVSTEMKDSIKREET